MRAVRAKAWKRWVRRTQQMEFQRWLASVAAWPFRDRLRYCKLVLFPPRRARKSAAEQKIIAARKKKREARKITRTTQAVREDFESRKRKRQKRRARK